MDLIQRCILENQLELLRAQLTVLEKLAYRDLFLEETIKRRIIATQSLIDFSA